MRSESERAALVAATAALLLHRERRSLRAMVRAERAALGVLRATALPLVEQAAAAVGHAPAYDRERVALATVRRTAGRMQGALERAIAEVRRAARGASRRTVEDAFAVGAVTPLDGREEHDAAAAHAAASSLSAAWSRSATAMALGDEPGDDALRLAGRMLSRRLERTAATETASAFNDERRHVYRDIARSPLADETVKVWSAVLDRRTCSFCFGKDGQVRAMHESFGAVPPVHPNCRCIVEVVRIPHPERLVDIGIDYQEGFKAELRDVIRGRREQSGRHAAAFLTESMGEGRRSPLVLTGRFTHQPYVRRSGAR
jgi:hypothetical protein